MDIFEQEYNQGLGETASDQFEKLAADIDGSNIMDKVNFPAVPDHPAGAEGRTLSEALAIVERLREGRGKITTLANKVHPPLQHPIHRDVAPVLSGGIQDPNGNDLNSVLRMKTAMEKTALSEKAVQAMAGTLVGAGVGAATGAINAGAVGGVTGAIAGPKGKRWESAGRGLGSGAGLGAITGAITGAASGALFPVAPEAAEALVRASGYGTLAGGIGVGIEEAKRVRIGIKPTFFQQKQYAAAIAKRKQASDRFAKSAAKNIAVRFPEKELSKGEKAGLITSGSVLGAGGLALGGYGVHKAHQVGKVGDKAIIQATAAGQNVAEQAKVIGDKVSRAAEDLSATSKQVSKAVEPAIELGERGKQTEEKIRQGAGRIKARVKETTKKAVEPVAGVRKRVVKAVTEAVAAGREKVPGAVRNVGGRLLKIVKRGSDNSFSATITKLGAEGQLRTLENWRLGR